VIEVRRLDPKIGLVNSNSGEEMQERRRVRAA
jgi:hypothetical protein